MAPQPPPHAPDFIELHLDPTARPSAAIRKEGRAAGVRFLPLSPLPSRPSGHQTTRDPRIRIVYLPVAAVDVADRLIAACGGTMPRAYLRGDAVPVGMRSFVVGARSRTPTLTSALADYEARYRAWWDAEGYAEHLRREREQDDAVAARKRVAPITLRAAIERAVKDALADGVPLPDVRAALLRAAEAPR